MKAYGRQALAALALLTIGGIAPGCGGEDKTGGDHEIWFMGSIYDGATGTVLGGYDISLTLPLMVVGP